MIEISMEFQGNSTVCSCSFVKGEETRRLAVEREAGAQALNVIVGQLARARLAGTEWQVVGQPELHGFVPSYPFRKPRKSAAVQLSFAAV